MIYDARGRKGRHEYFALVSYICDNTLALVG